MTLSAATEANKVSQESLRCEFVEGCEQLEAGLRAHVASELAKTLEKLADATDNLRTQVVLSREQTQIDIVEVKEKTSEELEGVREDIRERCNELETAARERDEDHEKEMFQLKSQVQEWMENTITMVKTAFTKQHEELLDKVNTLEAKVDANRVDVEIGISTLADSFNEECAGIREQLNETKTLTESKLGDLEWKYESDSKAAMEASVLDKMELNESQDARQRQRGVVKVKDAMARLVRDALGMRLYIWKASAKAATTKRFEALITTEVGQRIYLVEESLKQASHEMGSFKSWQSGVEVRLATGDEYIGSIKEKVDVCSQVQLEQTDALRDLSEAFEKHLEASDRLKMELEHRQESFLMARHDMEKVARLEHQTVINSMAQELEKLGTSSNERHAKLLEELFQAKLEMGTNLETTTGELMEKVEAVETKSRELNRKVSGVGSFSDTKALLSSLEERLDHHTTEGNKLLDAVKGRAEELDESNRQTEDHCASLQTMIENTKHENITALQEAKSYAFDTCRKVKGELEDHLKRVSNQVYDVKTTADDAAQTAVSMLREHIASASEEDRTIMRAYCDDKMERLKKFEAERLSHLVEDQGVTNLALLKDTYLTLHKQGMEEVEAMTTRRLKDVEKRLGNIQAATELQQGISNSTVNAQVNAQVATQMNAHVNQVFGERVRTMIATELRSAREGILNEVETLILPVVAQYCLKSINASQGPTSPRSPFSP